MIDNNLLDYKILNGDAEEMLKTLPDNYVRTCVTSPPYYGLRDYGVDGQIGLEETPDEYINNLVTVFREVRRVLADDGTLWVNIGDSYAGSGKGRNADGTHQEGGKQGTNKGTIEGSLKKTVIAGCKQKDLIGIPWMLAFALRADGWYLRQDIIWHKCLSGGTWLYAKTQKGVMPVMIKDLVRLPKAQLWDGEKWVNVVGWAKNERSGEELEFVLRSGERISCTPEHRFPTHDGLKEARYLLVGDIVQTTTLPDEFRTPSYLTDDALWFIGLYIAEGSKSGDTIQIAGHSKEEERWTRIQRLCEHYGARCTRTVCGNVMNIRVYGKVLNAVLNQHVSGRTARDKGLSTVCWQYNNSSLDSILQGYLSGDCHIDTRNNRYRLGFTRNYNLERDLRLLCARLGYQLTLNLTSTTYNGREVPTFRGEIRTIKSNHCNAKDRGEILEIRKARCRYTYDISVDSEPHLFSLASGVLTHNSNPMPESVKDRCTKAHEYVFLLSKGKKYYFDSDAVLEDAVGGQTGKAASFKREGSKREQTIPGQGYGTHRPDRDDVAYNGEKRNKRSVWTVATKPYKGAHFATFPPKLIEPCILAGAATSDIVLDPFCGSGTTGQVALEHGRRFIGVELNPEYIELAKKRIGVSLEDMI